MLKTTLSYSYLQDLSDELKLNDLDTMIPRIQRMSKDLAEVYKYEQVMLTIMNMEHLSRTTHFLVCHVTVIWCLLYPIMFTINMNR